MGRAYGTYSDSQVMQSGRVLIGIYNGTCCFFGYILTSYKRIVPVQTYVFLYYLPSFRI